MKSAIGENMTRRDHSDVSNQLVRFCCPMCYLVMGFDEILRLYFLPLSNYCDSCALPSLSCIRVDVVFGDLEIRDVLFDISCYLAFKRKVGS